jgi:hypothetical protein
MLAAAVVVEIVNVDLVAFRAKANFRNLAEYLRSLAVRTDFRRDWDLDIYVVVRFEVIAVAVVVVVVEEKAAIAIMNSTWALDPVADYFVLLVAAHFREHFVVVCYLVTVLADLAVAFHIFAVVLDHPSCRDNVHRDPFVVDLDRVDAWADVALAVDRARDDIFVDEDALVNDDQACRAAVVEHAWDALVDDHTWDVPLVDDDDQGPFRRLSHDVLAFDDQDVDQRDVGRDFVVMLVACLNLHLADDDAVVVVSMAGHRESFRFVADQNYFHYFHYSAAISFLCRADHSQFLVVAEVKQTTEQLRLGAVRQTMDFDFVHHSAFWVLTLTAAVAVVDIHSLLCFDYQYHFANALMTVAMPYYVYLITAGSSCVQRFVL